MEKFGQRCVEQLYINLSTWSFLPCMYDYYFYSQPIVVNKKVFKRFLK